MYLVTLFLFGLVICILLNLLVIVVLLRKGRDICFMDLLMISLSISDLLQTSIGYSVEIHSHYTGRLISHTSCKVAAFSVTFLGLVSIAHLVGIAVERHIVLRYPVRMRTWVNNVTSSLYVIVPSWIYGLLWALFPLLGWNRYIRQPGTTHLCGLDMTNTGLQYTCFNYNLLFWCFVLPVLIIAYCSYHICRALRSRRSASILLNMGSTVIESRKKMERQQTVMSLVIIGAFLFAWSPYACCVLVLTAQGSLSGKLLDIASVFAKTSSMYNPIIYLIFVEDFRVRCKQFFGCGLEPQEEEVTTLRHSPRMERAEKGETDGSGIGLGVEIVDADVKNLSAEKKNVND